MKHILITGANRGLGWALTERLLHEGHFVFAAARNTQNLVSLKHAFPNRLIPLEIDLEQPNTFDLALQHIKDINQPLDVLINNAGVHLDGGDWQQNTTLEVPMSILRKTFEINFFGLIDLCRRILPLLEGSKDPRIVNVSSIMGSLTRHADLNGLGNIKPFAYDASKTALNAFTVHLAHALKDGPVRVYSAHPGWVATDMGTQRAPLSPQEGIETLHMLAVGNQPPSTGAFVHLNKSIPW